jgi:zinc protease
LAGDINTLEGFELARRYFGEIPTGPSRPGVTVSDTTVVGSPRLLLRDRVELPRLYLSWRSPRLFGEGDAALDLLATILSSGKSSRLYRRLVHDNRIAMDVSVDQGSRELAGVFSIVATAAPGHSLAEIEAAITDELNQVLQDGLRDGEVERSQAMVEADFVYRLQRVGDFGGRSDQLNAYNVYLKDPGYFDADLDRYLRLDSDSIRSAAQVCLIEEERVALSVIPTGGDLSIGLSDSQSVDVT